jgi:maltose alpha-D-glucosyltransferase/alpha-amylase
MRSSSLWYKNAVFYQVYVRAYFDSNGDGHGDIQGVTQKLDYLQNLGIDCIWLMPVYPSPLKDDGYDIADYYGVLREYGTIDDLRELVEAAHQRGMYVITDLVLNHTSDQHPWFQAARSNRQSPYRDYYVWSDTDKKYSQARVIFIDTLKSNWTWDEQAGQYFWHRFYSSQPDLNYDNPSVQDEMENVARFWLDIGVDGFRADAVPYLFEREGTICENLPETHVYLKKLRRLFDQHYPDKILLCEANQWPEDVRPYFGDGDEFHMGFHFPVMPRIYMALRKGDREPLEWILNRTPEIPENCQWCVFLRNHDELTLEMVTEEERQWMWSEYAPEQRMRLNLGIRRRLAPLLDNDLRKLALANSLLFTLPGSPIIYYGDEIGMGDNIWLPDRNGVRTPMQWSDEQNAGFSAADPEALYAPLISNEAYHWQQVNVAAQKRDPGSLWNMIRKMISIRKTNPVFGHGKLAWVKTKDTGIAAYWRFDQDHHILVINNLTDQVTRVLIPDQPFDVLDFTDMHREAEIRIQPDGQWSVELGPFEYRWLKASIRK